MVFGFHPQERMRRCALHAGEDVNVKWQNPDILIYMHDG